MNRLLACFSKSALWSSSLSPRTVQFRLALAVTLAIGLVASTQAHVDVTEDFTDLGTGVNDTRFDTYLGNNIQRPIPTLTDPANLSQKEMGFGLETLDYSSVKTNQFGLTTTSNITGGSAGGEFGGQFSWNDYGHVADTDIGLTIGKHDGGNGGDPSDRLTIAATVLINDFSDSNDEVTTIGYFVDPTSGQADDMRARDDPAISGAPPADPTTTMTAGIGFLNDGRFWLYINGQHQFSSDLGFNPVPVGTPFDIDLEVYVDDTGPPGSQPQGIITGTVATGDLTNEQTVSSQRATNGSQDLGSFGIGSSFLVREVNQTTWRRSVVFFDDVTYSVDTDAGFDADPVRFGTIVEDADFDGDGPVTGLDFLIWQRNLGLMGQTDNSNGDANGDGTVDQADLLVWENKYGTTPPLSALSTVPEPASCVMLAFMGIALSAMRTRRSF